METKHTPGPWRYESTSGSNYARIFLSADEGDGDNLRGYCGEANARLIAAAPELLAAIQAMMSAGGKDEFQASFDNAKHLVNTLTT